MPRVLLIGLDCVPPLLAFEHYRGVMPNLARLMAQGTFGPLRSTVPPITVPAWASMLSGYDPGELGLYGFRNRVARSYELQLVDSSDLKLPMVWERLAERGQRVCVLGVPPSYPPRAVHGELVSCFLTPDASCPHTHPPELARELQSQFGEFLPDVDDYRSTELPRLLREIHAVTAQRFASAEYLLKTRRPDFMAMVDVAPDRFHHAFWSHIDPAHPAYRTAGPYAGAGAEYYALLDHWLGRLWVAAGADVNVLVVSDHGARALRGGICINEWLIEHGYLVLRSYPARVTPFAELDIDYARTRAWGEGGYYARIVLNVAGREPQGSLPPSAAGALLEQLTRELRALPGPNGEVLAHRIVTPQQAYRAQIGTPPELMVFFDNLGYRSIGSVGQRSVYASHNDTGPDGCNHDWDGICVLAGPNSVPRGETQGMHNADIAPTILSLCGVPAADLHGRDLSRAS